MAGSQRGDWRKATAIGYCLDASLAVLAAIVSQGLYRDGHQPPPELRALNDEIRGSFPPVDRPRAVGDDCRKLTDAFARRVFDQQPHPAWT